MGVVSLDQITAPAFEQRYGVPAINIFNDLTLEGVLAGAVEAGAWLYERATWVEERSLPVAGPGQHLDFNKAAEENRRQLEQGGQHQRPPPGDGGPERRARAEALPDPYAVLGVSRSASKDEIRAAYRARMREYHPDRVAHLGEDLQQLANRKTLEIQQAGTCRHRWVGDRSSKPALVEQHIECTQLELSMDDLHRREFGGDEVCGEHQTGRAVKGRFKVSMLRAPAGCALILPRDQRRLRFSIEVLQ